MKQVKYKIKGSNEDIFIYLRNNVGPLFECNIWQNLNTLLWGDTVDSYRQFFSNSLYNDYAIYPSKY